MISFRGSARFALAARTLFGSSTRHHFTFDNGKLIAL